VLGKKDRNEKMFYYVKIDDLIPEDHLLKLVHRYVDLGFIRKTMKHLYREHFGDVGPFIPLFEQACEAPSFGKITASPQVIAPIQDCAPGLSGT